MLLQRFVVADEVDWSGGLEVGAGVSGVGWRTSLRCVVLSRWHCDCLVSLETFAWRDLPVVMERGVSGRANLQLEIVGLKYLVLSKFNQSLLWVSWFGGKFVLYTTWARSKWRNERFLAWGIRVGRGSFGFRALGWETGRLMETKFN